MSAIARPPETRRLQVKPIRRWFGLTQGAFAGELGVSRATVARWEAQHSGPEPNSAEGRCSPLLWRSATSPSRCSVPPRAERGSALPSRFSMGNIPPRSWENAARSLFATTFASPGKAATKRCRQCLAGPRRSPRWPGQHARSGPHRVPASGASVGSPLGTGAVRTVERRLPRPVYGAGPRRSAYRTAEAYQPRGGAPPRRPAPMP